jgi:hypothetical protein
MLQRVLDKFLDQILAMVPRVGREPAVDRPGKLRRIAFRA